MCTVIVQVLILWNSIKTLKVCDSGRTHSMGFQELFRYL